MSSSLPVRKNVLERVASRRVFSPDSLWALGPLDTPYGSVEAEWLQFARPDGPNTDRWVQRISIRVRTEADPEGSVWMFQLVEMPTSTEAAEDQVLTLLERGFGSTAQRMTAALIALCQVRNPAAHRVALDLTGGEVAVYVQRSNTNTRSRVAATLTDPVDGTPRPHPIHAFAQHMRPIYVAPGVRLVQHRAGLAVPTASDTAHGKVLLLQRCVAALHDLGYTDIDVAALIPKPVLAYT